MIMFVSSNIEQIYLTVLSEKWKEKKTSGFLANNGDIIPGEISFVTSFYICR